MSPRTHDVQAGAAVNPAAATAATANAGEAARTIALQMLQERGRGAVLVGVARVDAIDAELLEQQREREAMAAQGWAVGVEGVAVAGPVELEAGAEGAVAAEGSAGG
jgi:hypothetical protein